MPNVEETVASLPDRPAHRLISRRSVLGAVAAGAGATVLGGTLSAPRVRAAAPSATPLPILGKVGIDMSHEQFPSPDLVTFSVQAEQAGFENLWYSDHFQPWQDNQGHAGYCRDTMTAVAERTVAVPYGSSVTCPTYRYRPAEIAQAYATLSQLTPGRVILGVGTGEALNEQAATGMWDRYPVRAARLIEAVTIIRELWKGQPVTFHGRYYKLYKAKLYDPPTQPIPIYIAATGPKAFRLAGRYGDGLITDPMRAQDPKLLAAFAKGAQEAGKDPKSLPIVVEQFMVVGDQTEAAKWAELWRFLPKAWSDYVNVPDPVVIRERADKEVPIAKVVSNWIVSTDPHVHAQAIIKLLNAGISHVQVHSPQADQSGVITFFGDQVLPLVKAGLA